MTEHEKATTLAKRLLNESDTNDELRMFSHQFLQQGKILEMHEKAVAKIGSIVRKYANDVSYLAIGAVDCRTIYRILRALSLFQPVEGKGGLS